MIKYVALLLICALSPLYAYDFSVSPEEILKITIKNNTGALCKLRKYTLIRGKVLRLLPIPESIPYGHEKVFFVRENIFYGTDIILTYACEASIERVVSFETRRPVLKHWYPITGEVFSGMNLDATYDILYGGYFEHDSIDWTLY